MKMAWFKLVFLFLTLCVAFSVQEKLKISVYYESLCPDSIAFIKRQLYPTYKRLHSIMDVDLVPYGKAIQNEEDGKWTFECQHGPKECFGNKVQSCALQQNYAEETEVAYVNCLMSQRNPDQAGETCADKIPGVSWTKINNCVTSPAGDEYLAANGDRTHALDPAITFVPTVIFNDVFNQDLMWDALRDLSEVICKIMKYPSVCTQAAVKGKP